MERIRNMLVMKMSMKGYYQKIPNDDIGCEAKPQENSNKRTVQLTPPPNNMSLIQTHERSEM